MQKSANLKRKPTKVPTYEELKEQVEAERRKKLNLDDAEWLEKCRKADEIREKIRADVSVEREKMRKHGDLPILIRI